MQVSDRERGGGRWQHIWGPDEGEESKERRLISMTQHLKKCEGQSRTDKENSLFVKTKKLLDRRMKEWEKANNKTTGTKVYAKKNTLAHRDSQDKSIEKHKALETWEKLKEPDKAFLRSCNIKP